MQQSLVKYIAVRFLMSIPMLLIMLTLVFFLVRLAPGDPVESVIGAYAPAGVVEKVREELGLNRPILVQYFSYLGSICRLDFGVSLITGEPVINSIKAFFPATLELSLAAALLAIVLGTLLGLLMAIKQNSLIDLILHMFSVLTYAVPVFWSGMLFQLLFGVFTGWLPTATRIAGEVPHHITGLYVVDSILTGNWNALKSSLSHLVLPAFTLSLGMMGLFARIVRVNVIETLGTDYVRTARAKGLSNFQVVFKHALRNAAIPVLTVMGMQFALLLGGSVLTETTFAWPGLGRYLAMSVGDRDYFAVQGVVAFFAVFVALISVLIDVACAFVNPQIRY